MIKHIHKTVHKLRQQPKEVREQILSITIIACTIILVLVWARSLGQRLGKEETTISVKKSLQPFSVLKDNMVDGYKSISNPSSDVVR
ncbi:MAG: hypothetical protein NTZ44_01755 [Candidatus Nomurabacteria bacterium]|nr:hypothetical protein [Candidatus Nomurabacteria bacterium]